MSFEEREKLHCSFCRKSEDAVGALLASPAGAPRVYICNECVVVCSQALETRADPFLGNPLLSEFLYAAEQWISQESKDRDASEPLSRMRHIARRMFVELSSAGPLTGN